MAKVLIQPRRPTAAEYNRLRDATGWGTKDASICEEALRNTLFSVCAVVDGQVVGMGRVVGDGAIWNYIQDVIVLPEFQRQGIGGRVMTALMEYLGQNAPAGSDVALIAAPGQVGFYERFGFAVFRPNIPGMRRKM